MAYSTMIQTYMCGGGHYTICRGRSSGSGNFCQRPPSLKKNSFIPGTQKTDSIMIYKTIKHIRKLLIYKAKIYLSCISENIIFIIGKCIMHDLCLYVCL